MASKMYNRARMTVTSTGTGALSLGVAVAGYQTFSSAGAQNSDTVSYTIEDGVNWEIGTGTFNSVAGTLSRTVTQSFNGTTYGTSAISVTTNAQVYITALAADIVVSGGALGTPSSATLTNATGLPLATGVTGTLPVANGGTGLTSFGTGVATALGNAVNGASGLCVQDASGYLSLTAATARFQVQPSTATNSAFSQYINTGGNAYIGLDSSAGGLTSAYALNIYHSGAYPIVFSTNGSAKATLDAAGNLGLGVTPSAWLSSFKATQIGNGAAISGRTNTSSQIFVTSNAYIDSGATWRYLASDYAVRYYHDSGKHIWDIASSGTAAGAISFTQAMTLDASGRLGVAETSPSAQLHVKASNNAVLVRAATDTNACWINVRNGSQQAILGTEGSGGGAIFSGSSAYSTVVGDIGGYALHFGTGAVIRATIDNSGNLLVGTTSVVTSTYSSSIQLATVIPAVVMRSTGAASGRWWRNSVDTDNTYIVANQAGTGAYIGNGAQSWSAYSDERLKNIIGFVDEAVSKINTLRPVFYSWRSDKENIRRVGLIAQDVQAVLPEAISERDGYLGLAYSDVIPLVIASIQELAAEVAALKGQLNG